MNDILWRRLRYMLSPQFDLYRNIGEKLVGASVLEVGFGTGYGTLQLARRARHVTALEIEPDAVAFAKASFPLTCITWREGDILSVKPEPIHSRAVMVEVLEHIPDWRMALQIVAGCLEPGGKLYLTARNRNADLRRNELHEREWTAAELKAALGEFFETVTLYDYTLTNALDETTRATPLIAVAEKKG